MGLEDFTTYDPVDPNTDITIIANKLTIDTCERYSGSHVTDDKGANHFGDFEHRIGPINVRAMDVGAWGCVWGISDTYFMHDDMNTNNEGMALRIICGTENVPVFRIYEYGTPDDASYTGSINTDYWFTIKRDGTSLTIRIYSDATRDTLLETLSVTCVTTTYKTIITHSVRD